MKENIYIYIYRERERERERKRERGFCVWKNRNYAWNKRGELQFYSMRIRIRRVENKGR